ncbi:MAG: heme exporter protein CcmD [Rhodobacteraceae bacterium]|nr:heme exporter protein CcmD [Paracoccaceae bacterium]
MMPELGKYADTVLSAYAASLLLLAGLIAVSLWRGRKLRAEMKRIEARVSRRG